MGFTTETTKVKINEHDKGGGESIQTGKEKKKKKDQKRKREREKQTKEKQNSQCLWQNIKWYNTCN